MCMYKILFCCRRPIFWSVSVSWSCVEIIWRYVVWRFSRCRISVISSSLNCVSRSLCHEQITVIILWHFYILSSYSRPDVLALGKYTLNLIGCSEDVAKEIYQMVEHLVPKVASSSLGPTQFPSFNKSFFFIVVLRASHDYWEHKQIQAGAEERLQEQPLNLRRISAQWQYVGRDSITLDCLAFLICSSTEKYLPNFWSGFQTFQILTW
jgi:hypothetical protein